MSSDSSQGFQPAKTDSPAPSLKHAKTLETQRDKLLELSNFLAMNQQVMKKMKAGFKKIRRAKDPNLAAESDFPEFMASLEDHFMRAKHHSDRVQCLIKRCDGLAALVLLLPLIAS
jgi:hypothetical protein